MQNMIWQKIEALQQEIDSLKNLSKKSGGKKVKKQDISSLYGLLKDVKLKVSWREFMEAKKIWSPHMKHIK